MKTAMQELIEELERVKQMYNIPFAIKVAEGLLEKEKEQMIAFGKKMQLVQHVSYDDDITYCFNPEKYYNETYQNK